MKSFPHLLLVSTMCAALALAGAGCQKKKRRAGPAAEKKKAVSGAEAQFEAARELLIDGKTGEAAAAFAVLEAEPNVTQPLLNWSSLLRGLALLLEGREPDARMAFAPVTTRPPFSDKEEDAPMVKFFAESGKALSSEAAIPAALARDYDRASFEGIALLLFALKNWEMGNFDEALPLLRDFGSVSPEKSVAWASGPADLKKLQAIAENSAHDYQEYRPAMEALNSAATTAQQNAAVGKAKEARARMRLTTKLSKELDAKIADLGPRAASILAAQEKASAEELAFDAKALPDAKKKRADFHAKFLFDEARAAMLEPSLKTGIAREEQQALAKKSLWLGNFKNQLIEDLNKRGYAPPLTSRGGKPIAGGVVRADAQQVYIATPRGPVPVAWAEIAPVSAFAVGQAFLPADLPPLMMAFRKWHLGVFGTFAGKPEGLKLLKEAAELRPVFAEEVPQFERANEPF